MTDLADALTALLGKERALFDDTTLATYALNGQRPNRPYPGLDAPAAKPWAVVRPASTPQVAAVVRLAAAHNFPIVPYGGGTGLMGGAVVVRPSIVVDLSALNRVLAISSDDLTATVEAGVILADLERELNRCGLVLGHDPWSLPIATVGGAISTDGLGYRATRYGSMGDQVLGLVVVLADGQVLTTRGVPHHSTGINLNRLFIGAEGCLGIITQATLRVFPQPEERQLRAYAFASFEAGFAAITEMFAVGLRPALVDYGESYRALAGRGSTAPDYEEPTLYVGFEGPGGETRAKARRAAAICGKQGGRDLGRKEARQFWDTRHRAAERYADNRIQRGQGPPPSPTNRYFDYIHVSIPTSQVLEYRRRCQAILQRRGIDPIEYGIWCQPELFSMVIARASLANSDAGQALAETVDELLSLAHDLGGSMEYCHGVGLRLAHLMDEEHGSAGLQALRAIKRALDPQDIMNPGKLGL